MLFSTLQTCVPHSPATRTSLTCHLAGTFVDYTLKENGGFLAKKMLPQVAVTKEQVRVGGSLSDANVRKVQTFMGGTGGAGGGGAPSHGEGAPTYGHLGKTRCQGIACLLSWDG